MVFTLKKEGKKKKQSPIIKKIRRVLRKATRKETITKAIIILSGLALIAGYVLPYIIR
jgi:hypothetical protein